MNGQYIGHPNQYYGAEEVRLVGGKGDGMRLLCVRNGAGLDFTVSLDRCADISRLSYLGVNYGYFSPSGYVAPQYYDSVGAGFLKSFTAGFFTTCGLTAVGTPCNDGGEDLPLHGTVSHIPAENYAVFTEENEIRIRAVIRDASLFSHGLLLEREYLCPIGGNTLTLRDKVTNIGPRETPIEILYHCNMGYPLLDETAVLSIPSLSLRPRNLHAKEGIDMCRQMEKPRADYEEMCFYHDFRGDAKVSLFNPGKRRGVSIAWNTDSLPFFTEWKMMGSTEYVLGLEPGNCTPDGRDVMRREGNLDFLSPGDSRKYEIRFTFTEDEKCL